MIRSRLIGVTVGAILPAMLGLALVLMPLASRAAAPDAVKFGVSIEAGDTRSAKAWLDSGLDPEFLADRIGTGLMIGAWEGNIAMMELFVAHGANVNQENRNHEQAIQLAAWKGHLDAVKWLLAHGATLNRGKDEWGALHYAVFAGYEDIARFLIAQGADVNARIPNGSTVLMMAAREGHEKLAHMLVDAGANPRLVNESGESALTWAMRNEHFKIAQIVTTPAELAKAAQAPPESFGKAVRSRPVAPQIETLMRQIREAEAQGRPVADLRKALFDAVDRFKKENQSLAVKQARSTQRKPPKALVITAKRRQPGGESAEVVYDATRTGAGDTPANSEVAQILRQLRLAEAQGQQRKACDYSNRWTPEVCALTVAPRLYSATLVEKYVA
jgi:hypothetical protein